MTTYDHDWLLITTPRPMKCAPLLLTLWNPIDNKLTSNTWTTTHGPISMKWTCFHKPLFHSYQQILHIKKSNLQVVNPRIWIVQKIGFMRLLWGSSFWFRLQSLKHCTYYHTTFIECFNSHLIHSIVKVQSPPCMQTC